MEELSNFGSRKSKIEKYLRRKIIFRDILRKESLKLRRLNLKNIKEYSFKNKNYYSYSKKYKNNKRERSRIQKYNNIYKPKAIFYTDELCVLEFFGDDIENIGDVIVK